ncbi:MAG TPA: type I 3-dehydroquinate dehydratase [Thermoanaerobaculia bacterium]
MQLVVTIHEPTQDAAINAIRSLSDDHDMVEVRLDAFGGRDVEPFRRVTSKPVIFTNRGGEPVDSDFGLIDVEYGRKVKYPERTVLSFHDFEGVPDIDNVLSAMTALGCAHTKLAVTPHSLRENEALLSAIKPGITVMGMGERGLYSRILAPFVGSELFFAGNAAPGQIPLDRALRIYGDRKVRKAEKIFAIAGNPAGQSLSPTIHNPLFRKAGVAGAYTIASFETFDEIAESFEGRRIAGLSVTAPFKGDALVFAKRIGADVRPNADEAEAINTLVRTKRGVIADNTDVDGFEILLRGVHARRAAVVGAGATARAAMVALRRSGKEVRLYNRTPKLGAEPIENLASFRGDLVVDTLPSGVHVPIPAGMTVIAAAYDRGGLQLLQAQAIRQNALFLEAFR